MSTLSRERKYNQGQENIVNCDETMWRGPKKEGIGKQHYKGLANMTSLKTSSIFIIKKFFPKKQFGIACLEASE